MSLQDLIVEAWAHSKAARQMFITKPDSVPAYGHQELRAALGTR